MCNSRSSILVFYIVLCCACCCCCVCIMMAVDCCQRCDKHNSGGAGRYATNSPLAQQGNIQPGLQMTAYAQPQQGNVHQQAYAPQQGVVVVQGAVQPAVVTGVVMQGYVQQQAYAPQQGAVVHCVVQPTVVTGVVMQPQQPAVVQGGVVY
jgi:hypothetical protein